MNRSRMLLDFIAGTTVCALVTALVFWMLNWNGWGALCVAVGGGVTFRLILRFRPAVYCEARGHLVNEFRAARVANLAAQKCSRCGEWVPTGNVSPTDTARIVEYIERREEARDA